MKQARCHHICRLVIAVTLTLQLSAAIAGADDSRASTTRYFESLRQRRLFSVATGYALRQLEKNRLPVAMKATLQIELSRTYAEQARYLSGEEQVASWQRAADVARTAAAEPGIEPYAIALNLQAATVSADHGDFLCDQAELFPEFARFRTQAETVLDTAIEKLRPLEITLAARHRKAAAQVRADPQEISTGELRQLWESSRLQLARSLQNRARLLNPADPRRKTFLADAGQWLEPLTDSRSGAVTEAEAARLLARNYRLQGNYAAALKTLDDLQPDDGLTPADVLAERVQVLLANSEFITAAQELKAYRGQRRLMTGELSYLDLRTLAELRRVNLNSGRTADAQQLLEIMQQRASRAVTELGGYWGVRCERLLQRMLDVEKYGADLAILIRQAQAELAEGRIDAAAARFTQAAATARQRGLPDTAFEMGFQHGSLLLNRQEFARAADVFRAASRSAATNPRAPQADLLAAYCLGKVFQADPSEENRQAYSQELSGHITRFPSAATTGDALWMLGTLQESRGKFPEALGNYRNVPADHARRDVAEAALARCYSAILKQLSDLADKATPQEQTTIRTRLGEWERDATRTLTAIVRSWPVDAQLSPNRGRVLLMLAQHLLTQKSSGVPAASNATTVAQAQALLARLQQAATAAAQNPATPADVIAAWKPLSAAAKIWEVLVDARQGDLRSAAQAVDKLGTLEVDEVLPILDQFDTVIAASAPDSQPALGRLQVQLLRKLTANNQSLDAATSTALNIRLATALVQAGQTTQAIAVYTDLLKARPNDVELLTAAARLQQETGMPAALKRAMQHWTRLQSLHKAGSVPWLEARFFHADLALQLGQVDVSRKLVGVTKVLYPDLGTPELKRRYKALAAKLQSP